MPLQFYFSFVFYIKLELVNFGNQRSQRPPKNLNFSKARWVEVQVKSVNCGDQQKCAATKLAAIKSYKWTSYIPSQNLQIAANFDSFGDGGDDQMLEINVVLDSLIP